MICTVYAQIEISSETKSIPKYHKKDKDKNLYKLGYRKT
jgi:hypothetical protein